LSWGVLGKGGIDFWDLGMGIFPGLRGKERWFFLGFSLLGFCVFCFVGLLRVVFFFGG